MLQDSICLTNYETSEVIFLDRLTHEVLNRIPVEEKPSGALVGPDGKNIYVTHWNFNFISVIDSDTHQLVSKIVLPLESNNKLALVTDGNHLYVIDQTTAEFTVIDPLMNDQAERAEPVQTPLLTEPSPNPIDTPQTEMNIIPPEDSLAKGGQVLPLEQPQSFDPTLLQPLPSNLPSSAPMGDLPNLPMNGLDPSAFHFGAMNPGAMDPGAMNLGALNPGAFNFGALNPGAFNPGAFNFGAMNPGAMNPGDLGALGSGDLVPGQTTPLADLTATLPTRGHRTQQKALLLRLREKVRRLNLPENMTKKLEANLHQAARHIRAFIKNLKTCVSLKLIPSYRVTPIIREARKLLH
ncbi:hypothetical protein [Ammoniphilus sp. CFH 90114]|uniref:hypothetical protein n=1 Tax=Ammoniphilus sp. CFH 90114 TaxID=2493665 RepID=UPI00100DFDD1|nr:hypothetical protein [Ammoniphilus sp. CFH 90114]RXT02313.1 hypothetical protein EIZ39_24955 [Ammoniphilus sp. CFH 90114]